MRRALVIVLAVLGSVLAGCSAQAPDGCGELVWGEGGTELSVDLTTFESCDQPTRTLELRNVGACAVDFDPPEHVSGDAVSFGREPREGVFFRVDVGASRVDPGRSVTVTVTRDVWSDPERKQTSVRLRGMGGESVTLHLEALPTVSAWDAVPDTLDFGAVMMGDEASMEWGLRNPTPVGVTYELHAPAGSEGDTPFSFGPGTQAGEVVVEPGASYPVALRFSPEDVGNFVAVQNVRIAQCEGERTVTLKGEGVASVLSWTPLQVDCGYVQPGVQVTRKVTFTNVGPVQVDLTDLGPQSRNEFFVFDATGAEATTLSIPAARKVDGVWQPGRASLTVACKPAVLGIRNTTVTFETSLPRQPNGSIPVKAFGGGPEIEVSPDPNLNFGKVAYFQNAFTRRKLTVVNVGTVPPADDPKANLRLGRVDPNTGDVDTTYFEVKALNGITEAHEFQVVVPASYDHARGLAANAGRDRVDLEVTFTPTSVGLKQAELTIYSNDPDEPATKILVSADAVVLPACDYTVTPTNLSFGLIQAPDVRDLAFTIKNNGTQPGEVCLLSNLDIAAGSHAFFSLPQGSTIDPIELLPNETKQFMVRVAPQGQTPGTATNITGMVEFFMSSPTRPVFQVNLDAQHGQN